MTASLHECGLCDRACPSDINLAAVFTQAKRIETHQRQDKEHKANIKQRYEAHATRLQERENAAQQRRAQRLQKRRGQNIGGSDRQVGS